MEWKWEVVAISELQEGDIVHNQQGPNIWIADIQVVLNPEQYDGDPGNIHRLKRIANPDTA